MTGRIIVSPDGFKGSISARAAAGALGAGWADVRADDEVVSMPVADGGEGTLDAIEAAVPGARRIPVTVAGPSGPLDTSWLLLSGADSESPVGVVELASTAGIELYRRGLDPEGASTRAFGEAILAALDAGVHRLVLGIGSSASTDGGAGMLAALGARFVGVDPDAPLAARELPLLSRADLSGLRPPPPGGVSVLTDVLNPLLGPRGAAAVFGPQKGLTAEAVPRVEEALRRYAALLPADPAEPGTGAAGGTGFGLRAWGAELVPGAAAIADLMGLPDAVAGASVVVTGEGSYDAQSAHGKAPAHVAALAASAGARAALAAGRIANGADLAPFAASVSLTALAGSPAAAIASPARWLRVAGAELARALG